MECSSIDWLIIIIVVIILLVRVQLLERKVEQLVGD